MDDIIEKLKSKLGKQTFTGHTREEIDNAIHTQINVLLNNLDFHSVNEDYVDSSDFILGAALSAQAGKALQMWNDNL